MLRKIWERAVTQYHQLQQDMDKNRIEAIDQRVENAKNGFEFFMMPSRMGYGAGYHRAEVSPARAADIIAAAQEERATIQRAMERRRNEYNLKP